MTVCKLFEKASKSIIHCISKIQSNLVLLGAGVD